MSRDPERAARLEIVSAGALLDRNGLILPGEGNLSIRIGEGVFLVTPSGSDKGKLSASDLVTTNGDRSGVCERASTELRVHLEIYRHCPGVNAVVHAHPSQVLALSAVGAIPDCSLLLEADALVAKICRVRGLRPGSQELALAVAGGVEEATVCVMEQHGAIAVADSMKLALLRMLLLERLAGLSLGACSA